MRLSGAAMGLKLQARGQMQRAVGVKETALLFHRDVGMHCAFEILLLKLTEFILNMRAQGGANVEVLSGDLNLHGRGKIPVSPFH